MRLNKCAISAKDEEQMADICYVVDSLFIEVESNYVILVSLQYFIWYFSLTTSINIFSVARQKKYIKSLNYCKFSM